MPVARPRHGCCGNLRNLSAARRPLLDWFCKAFCGQRLDCNGLSKTQPSSAASVDRQLHMRDENGNVVRTGTVTFAVGDATASVGSLAPGETIEIVGDNTVLADGSIEFDVQELASDNTDPPVISCNSPINHQL